MSAFLQSPWPELPTAAWRDTCSTLHLWTQIVGKIRLTRTPWLNHSWHVALYVTPRGLTTSPIPDGARSFQIDFDFTDAMLRIVTSDGAQRLLPLQPQSLCSALQPRQPAPTSRITNSNWCKTRPRRATQPSPSAS